MGVLSTVGVLIPWDYLEYCGGYSVPWGYHDARGDIMSTMEVFGTVGGNLLLFEHSKALNTHTVLMISPTVLKFQRMVSPTVLNTPHGAHDIPHVHHDIPHGTEYPPQYSR